jgi:hypothetical protein
MSNFFCGSVTRAMTIVCSVVIISACGGSDGTITAPPDSTESFSLSQFKSTTVGTFYTANLTGNSSFGDIYSGQFSMANKEQIMYEGVLVTPREDVLHLTNDTGTVNINVIRYIDTTGLLIGTIEWAGQPQQANKTFIPVSPDGLPDSVKIGDSGSRSQLIGSDNTTIDSVWNVEGAGNGEIFFIINSTSKDESGVTFSVRTTRYTLDSIGNILGYFFEHDSMRFAGLLTYESI